MIFSAETNLKKSIFRIFKSKESKNAINPPTPKKSENEIEVEGGDRVREINDKNMVDDNAIKSEVESKRKKSLGLALFENFGKKNKITEQNDENNQNTHLDRSDDNDKKRQEKEIQKESVHMNNLAHKVVESYKELMEIKERFEYERLSVQRAQVKRFLCGVFHDIEAIVQEQKYEKSVMDHVGDFFYNSLPSMSSTNHEKGEENTSDQEIQSQSDMSDCDSPDKKINERKSENEETQCTLA